MKILILGSEGFIGSHATRYFVSRGYEVYKADIVIKQETNYKLINAEHVDFADLFLDQQYDVCLNATGAANVQLSFQHPLLDYSLNVNNVYLLLDAIRKYNSSCRFINLSSAAVYGNPESLPVKETDTLHPLSPYGWHKLYSEQICREFNLHFKIPAISLRIFSAYGPGLKKQLFWDMYNKFIHAGKEPVKMFGTGEETRDFIYIEDLVRAIELVIQKAAFTGDVMNVASGTETTIQQAASLFINNLPGALPVNFTGDIKPGDPRNWRADIRRLTGIGFQNTTSMEEGIKAYISWIQKSGVA